ncbi:plasmid mobilization relaxosome protein MobC [Lachnospiraceae bacterium ZAX-1]
MMQINNIRAYLLKQEIDGRVIHIEMESIQERNKLLRNISNNVNQIAARANTTGNIYAANLDEIKTRQNEIWRQQGEIMKKLKHQFIVTAHTNTANPHTHIFFNSVDLECLHKFEDFSRSAIIMLSRKRSIRFDVLVLNGTKMEFWEKNGLTTSIAQIQNVKKTKWDGFNKKLLTYTDCSAIIEIQIGTKLYQMRYTIGF